MAGSNLMHKNYIIQFADICEEIGATNLSCDLKNINNNYSKNIKNTRFSMVESMDISEEAISELYKFNKLSYNEKSNFIQDILDGGKIINSKNNILYLLKESEIKEYDENLMKFSNIGSDLLMGGLGFLSGMHGGLQSGVGKALFMGAMNNLADKFAEEYKNVDLKKENILQVCSDFLRKNILAIATSLLGAFIGSRKQKTKVDEESVAPEEEMSATNGIDEQEPDIEDVIPKAAQKFVDIKIGSN